MYRYCTIHIQLVLNCYLFCNLERKISIILQQQSQKKNERSKRKEEKNCVVLGMRSILDNIHDQLEQTLQQT